MLPDASNVPVRCGIVPPSYCRALAAAVKSAAASYKPKHAVPPAAAQVAAAAAPIDLDYLDDLPDLPRTLHGRLELVSKVGGPLMLHGSVLTLLDRVDDHAPEWPHCRSAARMLAGTGTKQQALLLTVSCGCVLPRRCCCRRTWAMQGWSPASLSSPPQTLRRRCRWQA